MLYFVRKMHSHKIGLGCRTPLNKIESCYKPIEWYANLIWNYWLAVGILKSLFNHFDVVEKNTWCKADSLINFRYIEEQFNGQQSKCRPVQSFGYVFCVALAWSPNHTLWRYLHYLISSSFSSSGIVNNISGSGIIYKIIISAFVKRLLPQDTKRCYLSLRYP